MATAQPLDLAGLLGMLRKARDPWARLRLVATGARALAKLTPAQRRDLLRTLGLDGAEELAELAAGGDQRTMAAVENALRSIEADPERVQKLMGEVADPRTRRATLSGLAAHLLETLTAPASTPPPTPGAGSPPSAAKATPATPRPAAAGPTALRPPGAASPGSARTGGPPRPVEPPLTRKERREQSRQPSSPPAAAAATTGDASAPFAGVAAAPPAVAAAGGAAAGGAAGAATDAAPAPRPPPPAAAQPTTAAQATAVAGPPPPPPARPPVPPPSSAAAASATLAAPSDALRAAAERPARAGSAPLQLLRALRRDLGAGGAQSLDGLTTLVTRELPSDWARRRALAAAFTHGVPADVEQALALVAHLGSPSARAWALSDLAASRAWSDRDWSTLLAAADTIGGAGPGLRRRLDARRRG